MSCQPETDIAAEVARLLGSTEFSADLLPLLGMGRDVPDGKMSLRDERLDLDWRAERSQPYFDGIREKMRDVAEELGARFSDSLEHLNRVVTVHPLGGCPMERNRTEGVVNRHGAVFGCPPGRRRRFGDARPGRAKSQPDDRRPRRPLRRSDHRATKQLSRDVVYQTLGEDWKRFLLYREQSDPGGRFLSMNFRDLIG